MSNTIPLSGEWRLFFGPQTKAAASVDAPAIPAGFTEIAAQVPGNIELDLGRTGYLPTDLAFGDSIYGLRDFERHQFWYSRSFELPDDFDASDAVLVIEGVDTFATIWVNGSRVAATANMLVPHTLPVGSALRSGRNDIIIAIDSAVLWAHGRSVDAGTWAMENNWESLGVRKPPHAYGWDIMPRALLGGIWRDIRIEVREPVRFDNVYLATLSVDHEARRAQLLVRWTLLSPTVPEPFEVVLTVTDPDTDLLVQRQVFRSLGAHGEFRATVENIDLWWPRGYGEAKLYDVGLSALDARGNTVAEWSGRFGFRTVELRNSEIIEADGSGDFGFDVNGVDIFVKGSNWVPLDALHSRDASRLNQTFGLAVDLNCNMLRCWGGNVYEDRAFFDLCDEYGIMIWQDFALACALYPQTPEFHEIIRHEAETLVPMLRNHPSLVLWAGNNEIDQTYGFASTNVDPNEDDLISRQVLRDECRRLDPYRAYLPSSPYYGPEVWKRGDLLACPEDHLWGPRDDFKGPFYTGHRALFASEIGYHGCPSRGSLERMMRPEQLWPWQGSEDWLTHCIRAQPESTRHNYRIALMATQIEVLFGTVPTTLDEYILASQISQAEALKFFIEIFRIEKGRRSGILWWNIRDGWPQISDAVVDYYGKRKLAFHAAMRGQADVLVMLSEPEQGLQRVVVVNDTSLAVPLSVAVTAQGLNLFTEHCVVPGNGRVELGTIPASDDFRLIDITWTGSHVSGRSHYLGGSRPLDLPTVVSAYRTLLGDSAVDAQISQTED
ncbi:MAG: sugar-binding domain-containing protein [Devosia sp.]